LQIGHGVRLCRSWSGVGREEPQCATRKMQKSRCENRHDFLLRSVPLYPKILAAAAPRRRVMNSRRPIISVDSLRLGISAISG
jgi:hypothetical protein